ncbi:hypothetical protein JT059_04665 [Helicobacter pylori]|nr:hypothetical protein [Helicobacter pylori]
MKKQPSKKSNKLFSFLKKRIRGFVYLEEERRMEEYIQSSNDFSKRLLRFENQSKNFINKNTNYLYKR